MLSLRRGVTGSSPGRVGSGRAGEQRRPGEGDALCARALRQPQPAAPLRPAGAKHHPRGAAERGAGRGTWEGREPWQARQGAGDGRNLPGVAQSLKPRDLLNEPWRREAVRRWARAAAAARAAGRGEGRPGGHSQSEARGAGRAGALEENAGPARGRRGRRTCLAI